MDRRDVLKTVGIAGSGIALSGCIGSALGGTPPVEGSVEAKSITGTKRDTSYGIVLAQRGTLSVEDETYADEFANGQAVVVNAELDRQMRFEYRELFYNVHVKHLSANQQHDVKKGGSLAYRVDRELFNSVRIGDEITFESAGTAVPRIERVTERSSE